jgi:hypothetical protein
MGYFACYLFSAPSAWAWALASSRASESRVGHCWVRAGLGLIADAGTLLELQHGRLMTSQLFGATERSEHGIYLTCLKWIFIVQCDLM